MPIETTCTEVPQAPACVSSDNGIRQGTPAFRRANWALFAAGVATFSLLYCVQPLMPLFSHHYGISEATSALSLSVSTAVLAVSMLFAGAISDRWGRKPVMTASMLASALLTLATALAPNWHTFLLLRTLLGLTLSGLPAVAMTWLAEEMHPQAIGLAMGLYISGNAIGGLTGRMLAGTTAQWLGWSGATALVGGVGLVAAILFWIGLPASRHFVAQPLRLKALLARFAALFSDRALPLLFIEGFLLLGAFVTVYNFLGYRLLAAPYNYDQVVVGLIFAVYIVGMFSSPWMGSLASRLGRRNVLWAGSGLFLLGILLTMASSIWLILAGLTLLTFGFFGGHSVASSWVGRRGGQARAQASSMYLFAYYMGSSIAGAYGGVFYAESGWHGVGLFVIALITAALLIALYLRRVQPLAANLEPVAAQPES